MACVRLGFQVQDKLRIAILDFLRLVPRVLGRDSLTHQWFVKWSSYLLTNTMVSANGIKYRLLDFDSLSILSGTFEPFMEYWFRPQNIQIVVDVGAHIGRYTLLAAKAVGKGGKVIALEPNHLNYQRLLSNVRLTNFDNVIALNLAAWNRTSKLRLYCADMTGRHTT